MSIDESDLKPFMKCLMKLYQSHAFECLTVYSNFSSLVYTRGEPVNSAEYLIDLNTVQQLAG